MIEEFTVPRQTCYLLEDVLDSDVVRFSVNYAHPDEAVRGFKTAYTERYNLGSEGYCLCSLFDVRQAQRTVLFSGRREHPNL